MLAAEDKARETETVPFESESGVGPRGFSPDNGNFPCSVKRTLSPPVVMLSRRFPSNMPASGGACH